MKYSSGSRLHIFLVNYDIKKQPHSIKPIGTFRNNTPISSFSRNPYFAYDTLIPLLNYANEKIPLQFHAYKL